MLSIEAEATLKRLSSTKIGGNPIPRHAGMSGVGSPSKWIEQLTAKLGAPVFQKVVSVYNNPNGGTAPESTSNNREIKERPEKSNIQTKPKVDGSLATTTTNLTSLQIKQDGLSTIMCELPRQFSIQ